MEPDLDGLEVAVFGLGCFWGAERLFWQTEGVVSTSVGYAGGHTPNPTYEETCTGLTACFRGLFHGHARLHTNKFVHILNNTEPAAIIDCLLHLLGWGYRGDV